MLRAVEAAFQSAHVMYKRERREQYRGHMIDNQTESEYKNMVRGVYELSVRMCTARNV
jgi:hypothetical protein